jgi:pSer/pThr/pTyr-binding forkhead associated (FHA) protein
MDDDRTKRHRVPVSHETVARPGRGQPQLKLMEGPGAPLIFNLEVGEHVIGRGADVDVQILDESLSRTHVKISVSEHGETTATDLGSQNGLYCNELEVESVALRDGDSLRLGTIILLFRAGR